MKRLEQQMQFIERLDAMKQIGRQTYLSDGSRKENDAEHSWHLAIMAMLLTEYAEEPVDRLHVIEMVLIHDIIEIEAGDTYAYDKQAHTTKQARETLAADHLFSMLPEDQEKRLRALWDEFEAYETPEAKFAHMLDNVQPTMLNHASDAKAWEEHQVRLSQILNRNKRGSETSRELWQYQYNQFIRPHVRTGQIIKDREEPV